MSIIYFTEFQYFTFMRWILGIYSNYLVKKHVWLTPIREDIEREIVLDKIRLKQRLLENKRWAYWVKMCELAKKLGVDELKIRADSKLKQFDTEDSIIKRVEFPDDDQNN